MPTETTALARADTPDQADTGLGRMLEAAIALGTEGKDVLVEIVAMRREEEDRHALREFARAMAAVQADVPAIVKDRRNTQTNSSYATYSTVARALRPVYTHHGFSLIFGEGEAANKGELRILCDVMHAAGHVIQRHLDLPPDDRGIRGQINKTPIHARASSVSYGQRYLTCMIFAPEVTDEDRDGNPPRAEPERQPPPRQTTPPLQTATTISNAQRKRMWAIATEAGVSEADVREIVGAEGYESTADIPRGQPYDNVIKAIEEHGASAQANDDATAGEDAEPAEVVMMPDDDIPFPPTDEKPF